MKCFQVHNRDERTVVYIGTLYKLRTYMQECNPATRASVRVTEREVKIDKDSVLAMLNNLGRPVYDESVPSRLFMGTPRGGLQPVDAFPSGERYDTGPVEPAGGEDPTEKADDDDDSLESWTDDSEEADEEEDWS